MKKCPTCGKEFEDSMKFCQTDGTALVDAAQELDPYATMVGHKLDLTKEDAPAPGEKVAPEPAAPADDSPLHETSGSVPIAPPDEILELPGVDPLKTMYASDSELKEVMRDSESAPERPADVLPESSSESEPTIIAEPPAFGGSPPPPSPFSVPERPLDERPYAEPEPSASPSASSQFGDPFPSTPEWTPPPVPDAAWQNQQIDSSTPFQPPPAGAAGPSSGLAIGSLICGILSCVCCFSILTGPAAVIMGFIAKKKADENPAEYGGRGLAVGGMITGAIGVLIGIGTLIYYIVFGGLALMGNLPK
jgi:hypothetical protein